MSFYWPIALIVLSNVFYNLCSKSTPSAINPFASLTITYVIGALASGVLYVLMNQGRNLLQEYRYVNWSTIVLGFAIVGLEAGSIYMYKVGWNLGTGQLVYSSILAVLLVVIGCCFYHEPISWTKIAGMAVCMAGLFLMNR